MSRIHEALRRSAEEEGASATANMPLPADDDSMTALTREPFPAEPDPERRQRPKASEPAPAPDVKTEAAQDEEPAEPTGQPRRRRSIFERLDGRLAEKVVADDNMSPVSREQYRRLAGVLLDAQGNNGVRAIMVASAVPGEGKTLTATNLALTLSESYRRRVLLIDADLRKPTIHEVFRITAATGLLEGLDPHGSNKLVVRQMSPTLSILPAGRPTSDPMAALTSENMRHLLDEARATFDWVIIDTPPLMLLPDAHLLSSLVDGAVLVVKARSTAHDMVKRTADIIGRARVLGVVLNQADERDQSHYGGYYGGYYLPAEESKSR
jgi:capsular exopolysaccharide synthesis family protein